MKPGKIIYPTRWRRFWNRLLRRREVFYTMEIGATRMDPDAVVEIITDEESP